MIAPASAPALFAHRGSHRAHLENTIAAFEAAIAEGADGVELDVRTSRDGEVLVVHDPHLGRIAGRALWIGTEDAATLRAVELDGGQRIPRLDEVLDRVLDAGLQVNVEVKGDVPDRRATSAAVVRVLARRAAHERDAVLLSSFDPLVLVSVRGAGVRRGFLFDAEHTGRTRAAFFSRALAPDGVHPSHTMVTPARVRAWHRRGLYVAAWTVDDAARAEALARAGVDMLITDDVPRLAHARDRARKSA